MAKYSGKVGYVITTEKAPGVWTADTIEKLMRGDALNAVGRTEGDKINEDIRLTLRISVVADEFAFRNFMYIRYVWYAGAKWNVNSVEVMRPRLILNIGEVYNGQ